MKKEMARTTGKKKKNIKSEGLTARMAEKKAADRKKRRKLIAVVAIMVLVFGVLYGGNIVKLKMQNAKLKKQQEALLKERDEVKEQLKKVNSKDYIKEEARRQLRLLNPGEIMFLFEETEEDAS